MANIVQLEKEFDEVKKNNFWKIYVDKIGKEREIAVDHCIKDKQREDVRFFQGRVQAIDDVLSLPKRILSEIKRGSGNVSQ